MKSLTPQRAKSAQQAQVTPKTPVFNLYQHRRAIALNISCNVAARFKRRFPATTVKFSGFEATEGGAV